MLDDVAPVGRIERGNLDGPSKVGLTCCCQPVCALAFKIVAGVV